MTSKAVYFYGSRAKTFLSGTPYYFARALEAYGRRTESFSVVDVPPKRTREVPFTFLLWALRYGTRRAPLFLLSQSYHDRSARYLAVPANVLPYFLVWGQAIPASIRAIRRARPESRVILYNDATLLDLMATFGYAKSVPIRLREQMLRDERASYAEADLIVVFHEEVRANMIRDYNVPPEKIRVIGRGVNLDAELLDLPDARRRSASDHKFHMMIVGRDARRKGVFRLIDAIDALTPEEQASLVLSIAGPDKEELPARGYLRPLGFLRDDQRAYLASEMAASDLGVLLSDADSLPGSIYEFLALKVPVWVSKLPCIGSALDGYPAIIEDLTSGTPALTARLRTFLHQPGLLADLIAKNSRSLKALTWERPAELIGDYVRLDRVPA